MTNADSPMMKTPTHWKGRWRIVEMEVWDRDYLDLVVPAHITFDNDAVGYFQFGTVEGGLDCRFSTRAGRPLVEFSWDGANDTDPGSGRGWAVMNEADVLEGQLYIHCGDDSSFRATRGSKTTARKPRRTRR